MAKPDANAFGMQLVANVLVSLAAISTIGVGLVLAWHDKTASASTVLGVGFLMLVLLLLAKFKRFKGFGFEAELWEEKQEEASRLVERLKQLALVTSGPLVRVVSNLGYWDNSVPRPVRLQFASDLEGLLAANEFTRDEIATILEPHRSRTRTDLCLIARRAAEPLMQAAVKEVSYAIQKYPQPVAAADSKYARLCEDQKRLTELQAALRAQLDNPRYPDHARNAIKNSGIDKDLRDKLWDVLGELLADVEFYIANGQLRRPDIWLNDPGS